MIEEHLYRAIVNLVPIVCVDVAIMRNKQVLLVCRKDEPAAGQWWLPGGRVFKGEALVDAALRKAREEVGIECTCGPRIYTGETMFAEIHSVNVVFELFPKNDSNPVVLDTHHSAHCWVSEIDAAFHEYVQNSLLCVGLEPKQEKPCETRD